MTFDDWEELFEFGNDEGFVTQRSCWDVREWVDWGSKRREPE